ncbi:hypothetical protein ACFL17_10210, partial [Pseudomonadota bacterium]
MLNLILIVALAIYIVSPPLLAADKNNRAQFRASVRAQVLAENNLRLGELEECQLDDDIKALSQTVGYRLRGQVDCSYSPLEAARASFCSTNEKICIPHKQMRGLAKSMHRKYLGSSIVDQADGVMVVF